MLLRCVAEESPIEGDIVGDDEASATPPSQLVEGFANRGCEEQSVATNAMDVTGAVR